MEKQSLKSNLLFKNITINNTQSYKKFLEFHNDKNILKYNLFTLFISILFVFCICVQFNEKYYLLSLLFIMIFIFFISYRVFKPLFKVKKEVKTKELSRGFKNVFFFYEKYFSIKNKKGRAKINYLFIHKVCETPSFFYIYTNKENAYLISKEGFAEGTSKKFSKFIQRKALFKYSNYSNDTKYTIDIDDILS